MNAHCRVTQVEGTISENATNIGEDCGLPLRGYEDDRPARFQRAGSGEIAFLLFGDRMENERRATPRPLKRAGRVIRLVVA